jgi:ferredoxin
MSYAPSSRTAKSEYPDEVRAKALLLLRAREVARMRGLLVDADKSDGMIPAIARNVPNDLYTFVESLRSTLRVDNEPFEWEGHEYLIEPYKAMAVTGEKSDNGLKYVMMKGAQVGATVFGFLTLVWLAVRFYGRYFGYFLPDQKMAMNFSGVRFKPLARSIPEIKPLWGEDPGADGRDKKKLDQKGVRSIGRSQIFFSYMQGSTSTESIPMMGVIFDEVRKMLEGDIERAEERISHSPYPINFKYSTAGYPDANIDKYFKQSNQHKFHSKCGCRDGVVLADVFPDCIGTYCGKTVFVCPSCNTVVDNPRDGRWIAHYPDNKTVGYHIPQTLSCRQTPEKIMLAFQSARDLQEFYNSKLGIAYLAPESRIINEDILRATVNPDLQWLKQGTNFSMGIDQMGGFNVLTIRYWGPKDLGTGLNKSRLAHIEVVYAADPWERCDELMTQYDISTCVADALPNINEARRFAQRWPGRVWLADYSYQTKGDNDICEWGDRPTSTNSEKKSSGEIRNKYTVRIDRFLGIEWNLMKYVHRLKEQPNELSLEAVIQDAVGRPLPVRICKDYFWVHLQKVARRKVMVDEAQGKFKMIFENIGIDPHALHADLYCELALSRVNPDGSGKAFADFAAAARANVAGEHEWEHKNGTVHCCTKCGIAVMVKKNETAQQVAEKHGWKECKG